MTTEYLAQIKKRVMQQAVHIVDVDWLLSEVDKLRAENERLRDNLKPSYLPEGAKVIDEGSDQPELKACGRCGGQGWLEGWDDERRSCPICKGQGWSRDWEADRP